MRCLPSLISAFCSVFPASFGRPAGLPRLFYRSRLRKSRHSREETPSVQKSLDARLRLLAKKPDYTAFLLGSFPAYSYNAAVLETYLPVKAYNLTAENLSETEKMFDFAVENSNPSLFFFSIAACDFFPENTVKSAFSVQNLADGVSFAA